MYGPKRGSRQVWRISTLFETHTPTRITTQRGIWLLRLLGRRIAVGDKPRVSIRVRSVLLMSAGRRVKIRILHFLCDLFSGAHAISPTRGKRRIYYACVSNLASKPTCMASQPQLLPLCSLKPPPSPSGSQGLAVTVARIFCLATDG